MTQSTIVQVHGRSMTPYLRDQDYVLATTPHELRFGDLCLIKVNGFETIVHRYLGDGKFKGDIVKAYDNDIYREVELLGVITHRKIKEKLFPLNNPMTYLFQKTLGFYSKANRSTHFLNRLAFLFIMIAGLKQRIFENYLLFYLVRNNENK